MMKARIKYFVTILLGAVLAASCRPEPQQPELTAPGQVTSKVHYRVTVSEKPLTRASLNGLNQYVFESGDQLFVVDSGTGGDNMYGILSLIAGASDIKGTFEGDLMCLDGFEPSDGTGVSATLVSRQDKIHSHSNGKITGTAYPTSGDYAYAPSFTEAIRMFSDFTASNTYGARSFSLEQNSTFLIFSITFNDSEASIISASGDNTVSATFSNNGVPLRTGNVEVTEIDYSNQTNFVAAFPATALSGATLSFTTTSDTPISTYDDISDASLQPNLYYEVFKSHVSNDYFTVQARQNGTTITFNYTGTVEFRKNGGAWESYSSAISLDEQEYAEFRSQRTVYNTDGTPVFTADKPCYIYGDIMSLVCDSSWNPRTNLNNKAFQNAFKNATWIDIPAGRPLKLSATTLGTECYKSMFLGCTSLTRAPEISATSISNSACANMFQNCTSLVSAPNLPATSVGQSGYQSMFSGCTALTTVPAVIAGTTGNSACRDMFNGCTSLANAPSLPSTTVGNQGYYQMFKGCTSLVSAPELPATTIGTQAYSFMFDGCTSLISSPEELPATTLASQCYQRMFNGCTALTQAMAELPATVAANSCYLGMFSGCISLNNAPELKLHDIKANSCEDMFYGCTSLVTATGFENLTPESTVGVKGCYRMFYNCGELTSPESSINVLRPATLSQESYYQMFFGCAKITEAPDIQATVVGNNSCHQMFYNCKRLRVPPQHLAAGIVADYAYKQMFYGCTALASAPDFTGNTQVGLESCYEMFLNCSNLTSVPVLPATTLGAKSYHSMFKNSGLKAAPSLPATTLASECYRSMMQGCKSLEGPVLLPATTLEASCYRDMFNGASLLNSVVCLATDHSASECTTTWLSGVSATGVFMKPSGVSWELDSSSGIPTGWTAQDNGIDPIFDEGGAFDPEEEL